MHEDAPVVIPERLEPWGLAFLFGACLAFPYASVSAAIREFNRGVAKVNLSITCLEQAEQHRKGHSVVKSYEQADKLAIRARGLLDEAARTFKEASELSPHGGLCFQIAYLLLREDLCMHVDGYLSGRIFLKSALLGYESAVEWLIESVAKPTVARMEGIVAAGQPFTFEYYSSAEEGYILMNVLAASGRSAEAATFRDRIEALAGPVFATEITFAQRESQKLMDKIQMQIALSK